ncbi:MAG: methionine--tRNA ligase [Candidatus Moraniibacteriota bacterium]
MNRNVLIAKAWPYANGPLHIGHLAGLLGADVLARYFRLAGDNILFVSGTDCHGTPIMNRAIDEGINPEDVVKKYHKQFTECFQRLGFTHDLYTLTYTPEHHKMVQQIFRKLHEKGHLVPRNEIQLFCPDCNQFLVDRLVEGNCPYCHEANARGDQCDACSKTYEAIELLDPHCKKCGQAAEKRASEHLYFDLANFSEQLQSWSSQVNGQWRENAKSVTQSWLDSNLHDRAVTRDLEWGIDVPVQGFEKKKIYVWFDAVLGYLTTSIIHCGGDIESGPWEKWWRPNKDLLHYYVHGKDNIPFHTIIFPAMLMGLGNLELPTHIISSEYLNLPAGHKFSKSSGYGATLPQFFDLVDSVEALEVDSMRFFLIIRGPETKDSHFSWEDLTMLHNSELVNKFGNIVSRITSLISNKFDNSVPKSSDRSHEQIALLEKVAIAYQATGEYIEKGEFRLGCQTVIELIREANNLINLEEPWKQISLDPQKAMDTLNTSVQVLFNLRTLLEPFIPFAAQKLTEILNASSIPKQWKMQILPNGWKLGENNHIFTRIKEDQLPKE